MNQSRHIYRNWLEIAEFYSDLARSDRPGFEAFDALSTLCCSIAACHLGDQLYAHTSVTSLWISQTATRADWQQFTYEFLTITPVNGSELLFGLKQSAALQGNWQRRVDADDLLPCFDRFLRQLGWNYHPLGQ